MLYYIGEYFSGSWAFGAVLALEIVKVTDAAALASAHWIDAERKMKLKPSQLLTLNDLVKGEDAIFATTGFTSLLQVNYLKKLLS